MTSSVYVEEDRGRVRSDQRDYPYVSNAKQAAELCALDIAHSREGIAGRWPLKAYCRELEPGDVFTVDEPGLLLDGMDMLVLDRDYDPETDTPYVVFVSETPGKVAWALGQQANPSPTPALSARHDLNAPDPGAFDVVIVPPSPEGVSTPGAEVVIDIDNARAEDLVIEIGPSFDGPWRVVKTVTIIGGQLRVPVNELSPGEVFWVALSYRSADDGPSRKTIKGPYTAGDLIAGGLSPDSPDWDTIGEVADELIAEAEARQAAALATAKSQLQAADAATNAALSSADTRLTSGLNALSAALDDLALEDLDGFLAFSNSIQTALDGKATNGQLSGLATRVTTAEGTLTAQNTRLNTVETDLAGKAGATDLANLTTRVTSAEGVNAAQNTRLSTVEADVAGKASASALTDLSASVAVRNRTFYTATEPTNPYRGYPEDALDPRSTRSAGGEDCKPDRQRQHRRARPGRADRQCSDRPAARDQAHRRPGRGRACGGRDSGRGRLPNQLALGRAAHADRERANISGSGRPAFPLFGPSN